MKGISTIIASIVLVVITIGLISTAYLFVGGVLTGSISKIISLSYAKNHKIIIRNEGTEKISPDDIKINVDGKEAEILNPKEIEPKDTATLRFIPPELEMRSAKILVLGPSNSLSYTTGIAPREFKVTSGVVSLWHFNENNGDTTYDVTDNDNDGTLHGGLDLTGWTTNCIFDSCLDFDGLDDYVDISDAGPEWNFQNFTAELWIKTTDSNREIMGEGTKWRHIVSGTGVIRFWIRGLDFNTALDSTDELVGNILVNDDFFHHIAITYDISARHMKIYVDGSLDNEKITNIEMYADGSNNQAIGSGYTTAVNKINAIIDEVIVYNRVLSQEEILDSIYG
jgi:hypothetical protein